ncbi:MAG: hypothetical protein K2X82_11425 [Gemmataceae bacterium]|nr:hypothetical protein [Gemmataceae bacterium]
MRPTRLILALAALAGILPLAGCKHNKCCGGPSASYAIPAPCNDCNKPGTLPPGLPPGSIPANP